MSSSHVRSVGKISTELSAGIFPSLCVDVPVFTGKSFSAEVIQQCPGHGVLSNRLSFSTAVLLQRRGWLGSPRCVFAGSHPVEKRELHSPLKGVQRWPWDLLSPVTLHALTQSSFSAKRSDVTLHTQRTIFVHLRLQQTVILLRRRDRSPFPVAQASCPEARHRPKLRRCPPATLTPQPLPHPLLPVSVVTTAQVESHSICLMHLDDFTEQFPPGPSPSLPWMAHLPFLWLNNIPSQG